MRFLTPQSQDRTPPSATLPGFPLARYKLPPERFSPLPHSRHPCAAPGSVESGLVPLPAFVRLQTRTRQLANVAGLSALGAKSAAETSGKIIRSSCWRGEPQAVPVSAETICQNSAD